MRSVFKLRVIKVGLRMSPKGRGLAGSWYVTERFALWKVEIPGCE
jgi:hypothetical protein